MLSDQVDEYIKSKRYMLESWRFERVGRDAVLWDGPSCTHLILHTGQGWHCDCSYARLSSLPCSHVRALEALQQEDESFLESATLGGLEFLEWVPTVWALEPVEACRMAGAE